MFISGQSWGLKPVLTFASFSLLFKHAWRREDQLMFCSNNINHIWLISVERLVIITSQGAKMTTKAASVKYVTKCCENLEACNFWEFLGILIIHSPHLGICGYLLHNCKNWEFIGIASQNYHENSQFHS